MKTKKEDESNIIKLEHCLQYLSHFRTEYMSAIKLLTDNSDMNEDLNEKINRHFQNGSSQLNTLVRQDLSKMEIPHPDKIDYLTIERRRQGQKHCHERTKVVRSYFKRELSVRKYVKSPNVNLLSPNLKFPKKKFTIGGLDESLSQYDNDNHISITKVNSLNEILGIIVRYKDTITASFAFRVPLHPEEPRPLIIVDISICGVHEECGLWVQSNYPPLRKHSQNLLSIYTLFCLGKNDNLKSISYIINDIKTRILDNPTQLNE